MQFLDNLIGPTLRNLGRAMDRTTERHQLLTTNLANVNTPGYKRKDVEFGVALEGAMERGSERLALGRQAGTQRNAQNGSLRGDGNSVDLEREVMAIAETELRYQMLTDMTAGYFRSLKNVIKEGR